MEVVSLNCNGKSSQLLFTIYPAIGNGNTISGFVTLVVHSVFGFSTISTTSNVSTVAYMCDGLNRNDSVPSPKSQVRFDGGGGEVNELYVNSDPWPKQGSL